MIVDKLDKKILFNLEINSRVPVSKLAKLVYSSREVVNYRIKKLKDGGVIKGYIAKIDQSLFASGIANLVLKVRYDKRRYEDLIKFFKVHNKINWFASICGTYDFSLTFLYKTPQDLGNTIDEICEYLGKDLTEHHLLIYISEYKFKRRGIFEIEEKDFEKDLQINFNNSANINLDKDDLIVLSEFSLNCRISNVELAKKTGLSEDTIRNRIKNLEKSNIILGYTVTINIHKLELEGYHLYLHLENISKKREYEIKQFCMMNAHIIYSTRMSGKYNMIIGLVCKNKNHFQEELFKIREFFGDSMRNYEFQIILDEHKEVFVPYSIVEEYEF